MSLPGPSPDPLAATVTHAPNAGTGKPPARLGRYRLDEPIGAGGMGAVYKAFHLSLKRTVALKILHPPRAGDEQFAARFHREMEAVGRLDHPNVVRATDAGEEDGVLFLVMEYVDGIDLDQALKRLGPLPAADACELIRQAAVGLETIRQKGLLHRDLKPSNLVLSRDGVVKILDLGLARLRDERGEGRELTPSGCMMGTADYLAPEQAHDARLVDIRADVYSLGCTLYKLLTGRPPYSGPRYSSLAQKVRGHCQDPFPSLPDLPGVPAGLDALLRKMTEKDPARRPDSPLEVAAGLASAAAACDLPALLRRALNPGAAAGPPDSPALELPTPSAPARTTSLEAKTTRPMFRRLTARTLPWILVLGVAAGGALLTAWAWRTWGNPGPAPAPGMTSAPAAVEPAAVSGPRSLDDCTPLRWCDLLDREPTPELWSSDQGLSDWKYTPGLKQLAVNSTRTALFRLGTVTRENYVLQIGVSQTSWIGGPGVYLGYRAGDPAAAAPGPNRTVGRFQFVAFGTRVTPQGVLVLTLTRGKATVKMNPEGRRLVNTDVLASEEVHDSQPEQVIEVTVSGPRMTMVRLNGAPMPKLYAPDVNAQFSADDYRGPLGTANSPSSSVYRNARFMIQEGP